MNNELKSKINHLIGGLIPINFTLRGLEKHPHSLLIEPTNICNAKCVYCGYRFMRREKGVMLMDVFKKLIDEFSAEGGGDINLTGIVGEPLLDSAIVDKIRYARGKKNIRKIKVSTNGILLGKIGIERILRSGLDSILINIGGMDERTYRKLFGVDAFGKVYENVKNLLLANKAQGNRVNLSIVVKTIWSREMLEKSRFQALQRISTACNAKIAFDAIYDSWCGRISVDKMLGEMRLKEGREKKEPCSLLFNTLTVTWKGDVVPCCRDLDGEVVLGSIIEQSVDEVWKGERIKNLRNKFRSGNIPEMCTRCEHFEGLKSLRTVHLFRRSIINTYSISG